MNILRNILVAAALVVVLISCRREPEARPVFPSAEYFTPSVVKADQQVTIYGVGLDKATVLIDGTEISVDFVSGSGDKLIFKVAPGLSIGKHFVEILFEDGDKVKFTSPLVVSLTGSTIKELLIGDFDGAGIRPAYATADFTNGQWSGNAGANTVMGIGNLNGVLSSPAGGNYAFATVPNGGVLPNTFGFVATIESRSELNNDFETAWPKNFFEYKLSSLDSIESNDISNYYLNFYVNFNSNNKSKVRVFVGNPDLGKGERFAEDVAASTSVSGWQFVSIPLDLFKSNFGNDTPMNFNDFKKLNMISFDVSDTYENIYSDCCCKSQYSNSEQMTCPSGVDGDLTCCPLSIKDPVQVYFDHVTITQGGPAYDYSK